MNDFKDDNDYFTLLPNNLVLPQTKDEYTELSLLQKIKDDKLILILDYLYTNTNRKGFSMFSLEQMITDLGYKPDRGKNRINDKFKYILTDLQKLKILNNVPEKYNVKDIVFCRLDMINQDDNGNNTNFFQLHEYEKEKILNVENSDTLNILKLYCYLKARMYTRSEKRIIHMTGGKAQSCYPSYVTISSELGISETNIKQYIDVLSKLNLIRYDNNGLYYNPLKPNSTKESNNNYVLYDEHGLWKSELEESLKWQKKDLISKGYMFYKNNKYKNNDKSINGKKGYLKRMFNQGKISEEEYNKQILSLEKKEKTIK